MVEKTRDSQTSRENKKKRKANKIKLQTQTL